LGEFYELWPDGWLFFQDDTGFSFYKKRVCKMTLSASYMPVWLQKAMSLPHPTRVCFTDSHYVSVFPDHGRYDSNIQDWTLPSLVNPDMAPLTYMQEDNSKPQGRPLVGLCWNLLLQHLTQLQRQPQDYPFQFKVVRLVSWPSLTHLPPEVQPSMARLCALLARKPSAASLLPLLLNLAESQVFMLIEALHLHGHIQVADMAANPDGNSFSSKPETQVSEAIQPAVGSLIANIWQRLLSRR
jgi:hypothetical protein